MPRIKRQLTPRPLLSLAQHSYLHYAKARRPENTHEVSAYLRSVRRLKPRSRSAALQQWAVFERALYRLCSASDRRRRFPFDKRLAKYAVDLLTDTFEC